MSDELDVDRDVAAAIEGAGASGHAVVLGYIGDDDTAAVSFHGNAQVYGPEQLAIWARESDDGFAKVIAEQPEVSLLYYSTDDAGGKYLSIEGRARVDPSANDGVYTKMLERDRQRDPERDGVAVIIDVESITGVGAEGALGIQRSEE